MTRTTSRDARAAATQEAILTTAEQLFAEHGIANVSNRQISEAAGQGNNAAVGYHFGTKTDLVRAIAQKHAEAITAIRERMLAEMDESADLRDWVACLVEPVAEHLDDLGDQTWYARFTAQLSTDPALRLLVDRQTADDDSIRAVIAGIERHLPAMPPEVWRARATMMRYLLTQMNAERERAIADGAPIDRERRATTVALVDAITGMLQAPVTAV
ncbi:TetR/AcrR family transcriptional regulator [Mumia zhuanghuii]|uniref:TetR/AcrR family transcriptional regulator n=2 Tax=Mumia TaxID=1546255 RepID=A0ABW1QLF3_9ACTN|nr:MULTISPECIES: TetR/AcrR family transcriptional regulator [Mumia]KAA1418326.1 TetR/AcrR family transcriptional regulator [Mumia zhuanghuii]